MTSQCPPQRPICHLVHYLVRFPVYVIYLYTPIPTMHFFAFLHQLSIIISSDGVLGDHIHHNPCVHLQNHVSITILPCQSKAMQDRPQLCTHRSSNFQISSCSHHPPSLFIPQNTTRSNHTWISLYCSI